MAASFWMSASGEASSTAAGDARARATGSPGPAGNTGEPGVELSGTRAPGGGSRRRAEQGALVAGPHVAIFVEDHAHELFLVALIRRVAAERGMEVAISERNVRGGHPAVLKELRQYLRDLRRGIVEMADMLVVATDANCKGINGRTRELAPVLRNCPVPVILAIPDPHIERWFLLDSAAFKQVFGKGCRSRKVKCERSRYRKMLIDSILACGIEPSLGGIEFAESIVQALDLKRAASVDRSFRSFIQELRRSFREYVREA